MVQLDGALTAGGDAVTVSSGAAGIAGIGPITADTVDLNAATGIGSVTTPLEVRARSLSADTTDGDISLANSPAAAAEVTSAITGTGAILVTQTGGGDLSIANAETGDGDISVTSSAALDVTTVTPGGAASGDGDIVLTATGAVGVLGPVTAQADTVAITSTGADINGVGLITADTLDLNAETGIGSMTPLELSAAKISADTTNGDIVLDNVLAAAARVTSATTGVGNVALEQFGTGALTVQQVTVGAADILIAHRGSGNLSVENAATGGSDIDLFSVLELITGRIVAGADGDITYEAGGSVRIRDTSTAAGKRIAVNAGGSIVDEDGDVLDLDAAELDLIADGGIGVGDALETRTPLLTFNAGAGIEVDTDGSLRVQGASGSGLTSIASNGSLTVNRGGVDVGGDLSLAANGGVLTLSSLVQGGGDMTLYGADGVRQNAAVIGSGGSILVYANILQPDGGSSAGEGIVMAPGATTRSLGGSIDYLANNDIVIGLLDTGFDSGSSVRVTAVGGDLTGADRNHGIMSSVVTVQAIGGQIAGGPTDPLLVHPGAVAINVATTSVSYIDSMTGVPIDGLINNLTSADYLFGGQTFSISNIGGQIVILSSVSREASASVQQVSAEELEDVSDALLQEAIEVHTVPGEGVELPADQRDEAPAMDAGEELEARRWTPLSPDLTGSVPVGLGAGAWLLNDPDAALDDGTPARGRLLPAGSAPARSGETTEVLVPIGDLVRPGPALSWNGELPQTLSDGFGFGFGPRRFAGIDW